MNPGGEITPRPFGGYWVCRECGHRNMMEDGPVCENCETDNTRDPLHPQDVAGAEDGVGGVFSDADPGL